MEPGLPTQAAFKNKLTGDELADEDYKLMKIIRDEHVGGSSMTCKWWRLNV